jgi:hypothetical protein
MASKAARRGGGEHDTNAARADREGSSQSTLEQALEPKRDVATLQQLNHDRGALNRLGFERRRVQQLPRIHVVVSPFLCGPSPQSRDGGAVNRLDLIIAPAVA